MARKKEIIQKEWDTAQENLTTALNKATKGVEDLTLTAKDVEDAQAKYDIWKTLLNESIVKIADWKNEKDKKRLEWMKYVETQKTKVDRNYVARIKELWTDAATILRKIAGREALTEVINQYGNDAQPKLEKVSEVVKEIVAAIKDRDAVAALQRHGAALNYLKGVTSYASKAGMKKLAADAAKVRKATLNEVDLNDKDLRTCFTKTATAYEKLTKVLDDLEPTIGELADELSQKEPETDNPDPLYKTHLKEIQSDYKEVVAFALSGLAKTKKNQAGVGSLAGIAAKTTADKADKVADAAVTIFENLKREYGAVDKHIQETIRTTSSTVTVKKKSYGITEADQTKTLAPLMNRAFALNYQAKAAFENSIDGLRDILEDMAARFGSEKAKTALGTVTM